MDHPIHACQSKKSWCVERSSNVAKPPSTASGSTQKSEMCIRDDRGLREVEPCRARTGLARDAIARVAVWRWRSWSQLTHRYGAQNEQRHIAASGITALDDQEPRTPLLCADDVAYRLRAARGRKREPGLHGTWGYLCFVWWQRVCQHT